MSPDSPLAPVPDEVLALLAAGEADLKLLRHSTAAFPQHSPVRTAVESHAQRYASLVRVPGEWGAQTITWSMDRLAALRAFVEGTETLPVAPSGHLPVELQLRRQVMHAWMRADATHLAAGRLVHEPFMCHAAPEHLAQRKAYRDGARDADEFNTLFHFLPQYYLQTGRLLTLYRKGVPEDQSGGINEPDFLVVDVSVGCQVGVEITAATCGWRQHRDGCLWELMEALEERLPGFHGIIEVCDRQYDAKNDIRWDLIANQRLPHRETFLTAMVDAVLHGKHKRREGTHRINVAEQDGLKDILIRIRRKNEGGMLPITSDQYGWPGSTPEQLAGEDLIASIKNKVNNPKAYSTRETLLVVHPTTFAPTFGYENVIRRVEEEAYATATATNRFNEAWVAYVGGLWCVAAPNH